MVPVFKDLKSSGGYNKIYKQLQHAEWWVSHAQEATGSVEKQQVHRFGEKWPLFRELQLPKFWKTYWYFPSTARFIKALKATESACKDPKVRRNANEKQNGWTRHLWRPVWNSISLEHKVRSMKWWEIRLEISAGGPVFCTSSLSSALGYIFEHISQAAPHF